jgi:hypothetical protein
MTELDTGTLDLARELGELRLLWLDMSQARALFERRAEMPDGLGDFRLASALWISGLIAYRRCFAGGTGAAEGRSRGLISQDLVDALEPEQRRLHGDALLTAERYVARRVTDHHDVEVWLEVESGPPPRVRRVRSRQIPPVVANFDAFEFAALAKQFADQLEEKCRRVEVELVASANASEVGRRFAPTGESPEWVNILSSDPGPTLDDAPEATRPTRT